MVDAPCREWELLEELHTVMSQQGVILDPGWQICMTMSRTGKPRHSYMSPTGQVFSSTGEILKSLKIRTKRTSGGAVQGPNRVQGEANVAIDKSQLQLPVNTNPTSTTGSCRKLVTGAVSECPSDTVCVSHAANKHVCSPSLMATAEPDNVPETLRHETELLQGVMKADSDACAVKQNSYAPSHGAAPDACLTLAEGRDDHTVLRSMGVLKDTSRANTTSLISAPKSRGASGDQAAVVLEALPLVPGRATCTPPPPIADKPSTHTTINLDHHHSTTIASTEAALKATIMTTAASLPVTNEQHEAATLLGLPP